jgi:hypothetical protein
MAYADITMKDTVRNLRVGWYGNKHLVTEQEDLPVLQTNYTIQKRKPIDCNKLFLHAVKIANETFIPPCAAITGTIGDLVVVENHQMNREGLPIDLLIIDINRALEFDNTNTVDI